MLLGPHVLQLKQLAVTRVSRATPCHCALALNTSYSLCSSFLYLFWTLDPCNASYHIAFGEKQQQEA